MPLSGHKWFPKFRMPGYEPILHIFSKYYSILQNSRSMLCSRVKFTLKTFHEIISSRPQKNRTLQALLSIEVVSELERSEVGKKEFNQSEEHQSRQNFQEKGDCLHELKSRLGDDFFEQNLNLFEIPKAKLIKGCKIKV